MSADAAPPTFGRVEPGAVYVDRPCAYGVALRGGDVLLVDTPKGRMLPGGGLDAGETHEQALAREVREETGLAATVGAFLGEAAQLTHDPVEGMHYRKMARFYRMTPEALAGPPSETDHVARWIPVPEALRTMTGEAFAWAIRCATGGGA